MLQEKKRRGLKSKKPDISILVGQGGYACLTSLSSVADNDAPQFSCRMFWCLGGWVPWV